MIARLGRFKGLSNSGNRSSAASDAGGGAIRVDASLVTWHDHTQVICHDDGARAPEMDSPGMRPNSCISQLTAVAA
jgi:hypothetical protein